MKRMKKIVAVMISMVVLAGLLAGCGDKNKLADSFDENTVKQQAQEDITVGESGDFEAWRASFSPEAQPSLTQEIYDNYLNLLGEKGEFKEFGKCAILGQEQDGKNYAVAVYVVKHEKGDVKYTLAYDENMKLIQYTI